MAQGRSLDNLVAQTRRMKRHPVFRVTFWAYIRLWLTSVKLDPIFARTFLISLPPSCFAALLEAFNNYDFDGGRFDKYGVYLTGDVYTAVATLLGFVIVFRISQAYLRFWEACTTIYQMQGEIFDGASSLVAFCATDQDMQEQVSYFRHTLIRLMSLLNAFMLMELQTFNEGSDCIKVPILDPDGLEQSTMKALETQACRVEVVCQWVQQLAVAGLRSGVVDVPAPIATRAFQEIGAGVLRFHEALKIAQVPFPSPYMATMVGLLLVHTVLTPISITGMVDASGWAFVLTFVSVFTLWSLALLGLELDNPFQKASNRIIDLEMLQNEHNTRLLSLISAAHCPVPRLLESAKTFKELAEIVRLEHEVISGVSKPWQSVDAIQRENEVEWTDNSHNTSEEPMHEGIPTAYTVHATNSHLTFDSEGLRPILTDTSSRRVRSMPLHQAGLHSSNSARRGSHFYDDPDSAFAGEAVVDLGSDCEACAPPLLSQQSSLGPDMRRPSHKGHGQVGGTCRSTPTVATQESLQEACPHQDSHSDSICRMIGPDERPKVPPSGPSSLQQAAATVAKQPSRASMLDDELGTHTYV